MPYPQTSQPPQPKPSSLPGLIILGLIGFMVYQAFKSDDRPLPPDPSNAESVAFSVGRNYLTSLGNNYQQAYDKVQSGEITTETALHNFLSEANKQSRVTSFKPMDEILNQKAGDFPELVKLLIPISNGHKKSGAR